MLDESGSIVARLTPPGKSALASLGVAGPRAWTALRSLFRRPRQVLLPDDPDPGRAYFGSLGETASGADDVVLFIRSAKPKFSAEVNCHGGPEAIKYLESLLVARGLDRMDAETWSAQLNGAEQADMHALLARCATIRTAAIALDQMRGAFARVQTEIEALLAAGRSQDADAKIARLRDLIPVGTHLARSWTIAVVGEPNVGKSSLVNAIAGFARCIVSPTPGTTRDVVSTTIAIAGWPIELLDTAGVRDGRDALECEGIARGQFASLGADLVLRVVDATQVDLPVAAASEMLVVNKIDRNPEVEARSADDAKVAFVSAKTNGGIDRLLASLCDRLVPCPPRPGEAVPVTDAQREFLARPR